MIFFVKKIKEFLFRKNIRVLCFGLISLAIGALLTFLVQNQILLQQQHFEIYKARVALINEISSSVNARRWTALRVIWVIKGTATDKLEDAWGKYYKSVEDWNMNLPVYAARMKLYGCNRSWIDHLVNDQEDGGVIWGNKSAVSLHGYLLVVHKRVKQLYECTQNKCSDKEKKNLIDQAEKSVLDLGRYFYDFIELSACNLNTK